jgi:hypothetical protein
LKNIDSYGSYSSYGMELGYPAFVPVRDPEMGFEKIVNIAHARGGKSPTLLFTMFLTFLRAITAS